MDLILTINYQKNQGGVTAYQRHLFFFFFLFHVIRLRHNRSQPSSVSVPTCEGGEQTVPGHFLKINLYFQEVRNTVRGKTFAGESRETNFAERYV